MWIAEDPRTQQFEMLFELGLSVQARAGIIEIDLVMLVEPAILRLA